MQYLKKKFWQLGDHGRDVGLRQQLLQTRRSLSHHIGVLQQRGQQAWLHSVNLPAYSKGHSVLRQETLCFAARDTTLQQETLLYSKRHSVLHQRGTLFCIKEALCFASNKHSVLHQRVISCRMQQSQQPQLNTLVIWASQDIDTSMVRALNVREEQCKTAMEKQRTRAGMSFKGVL